MKKAVREISLKTHNSRLLPSLTVAFVVLLGCRVFAAAQSLPRLRPLPPRKTVAAVASLASMKPESSSTYGGSWQLLTNQPPVLHYAACGPRSPLLLTDGTVLIADDGCEDYWKLTPDQFGSYVNGTWSQVASMPADYNPLYHASAVLTDGRVIFEGGEYNFLTPAWTDLGAIYDPVAMYGHPLRLPASLARAAGLTTQPLATPKVSFCSTAPSCWQTAAHLRQLF